MIDPAVERDLRRYADLYETPEFLEGDPSWFMHQVHGAGNREATAFLASCLSFGSRSQFMPKIQGIVDLAGGDVESWVGEGRFTRTFARGSQRCFYRFFTYGHMRAFLDGYRRLIDRYGSLGAYVRKEAAGDGYGAVAAICRRFGRCCDVPVVPADHKSACKRVCMFLRWMVRGGSPVDLGLWADAIDRRTLVMPLDTHVLHQAVRLGLLAGSCASMSAARRLTATLAQVFPDDPLRGDFALFGYGVNHK